MTDWYFAGYERRGMPVSGPAISYDPATTAWVNAVVAAGGSVSAGRQAIVNALIVGLKADGLWTKFDRLWVLAAENTFSALIDLVGLVTASPVSSPTFTTDRGYTGDGSTSYIDTGFNPLSATSPIYTQDNAHFSHWNLTNSTSDQVYSGASNTIAAFEYFSGSAFFRVNDGSGGITVADPRGHLIATRGSSASRTVYQNGSSIDTTSASSVALPGADYFVLWSGNSTGNKSASQSASFSLGGDLSGGSDAANFYNRLRTYMTAVGVP
jgi:hypothetical protein